MMVSWWIVFVFAQWYLLATRALNCPQITLFCPISMYVVRSIFDVVLAVPECTSYKSMHAVLSGHK